MARPTRSAAQKQLTPAWLPAWLLTACWLMLSGATAAPAFETSAPAALLLDFETGAVLFEKNADEPYPPASLAKLMTVEVLFHQLKQGRVSLDDEFTVSEKAWREGGATSGGSTMFLPVHARVPVRDLIRGIVVQSGNDAAIVVAEGLAGTEERFAELMNRRAAAIGMSGSTFANSHGLPHPEQRVTLRDLGRLAAHLIREYPEQYGYFGEESFTYNKITQRNRNPLLDFGADGLKTGHTSEAGYSLVASMERDGRRLVVAVAQLESAAARAEEARKLLDWGFRAFENVTLLRAGAAAGEVPVLGGAASTVPAVARADVKVTVARGEGTPPTRLALKRAVHAPVAEGEPVGVLQVGEGAALSIPLYAGEAVELGSLATRAWDAAADLVRRAWETAWDAAQPAGTAAVEGSTGES